MGIAVRNLSKYYGAVQAVNDISFDVKTGEILGFLGPNGAGKTTTMKIITCFMPPTEGDVEIDGLNIFEHSLEVRKKIGYLPESNPLYNDMNVLEFLNFCAKLQGLEGPRLKQRLREMIDVCGIGRVRHKDIRELSKGYKQRVGLAQAMIHDPDVLILDEPTSGLDPNQIVEIRNLIKRIGVAKTVILSTHILSEVQATCDRVIIINNGGIVADGSLEKLREDFQGSELFTLEIKAPDVTMEEIHSKFDALDGAKSTQFISSDESSHKFAIRSVKGEDLREAVFNLAVEQKWTLLEMQRKTTSLEELFHKLTKTEVSTSGRAYAEREPDLQEDFYTPPPTTVDKKPPPPPAAPADEMESGEGDERYMPKE